MKALDYGIVLFAVMSLGSFVSLIPSTTTGPATVSNGTMPSAPSGAGELLTGMAPYVELLVAGLLGMYKYLKDRNWFKRKYKDVVVTKSFP